RPLWFCCCVCECKSAQINQPPSLVLEKGHRAQLVCNQTYGHNNMFWYRQDPGQGFQLLFLFVHKQQTDKGNVTDRFQAERPQTELFHLDISPPEDSAVYFCASSLDTVLQSHLLPLQKTPPLPEHHFRERNAISHRGGRCAATQRKIAHGLY
uniref:Immunoglobulin V-set domain-containing protein n=1 Tax=Chrysemys picta bellii TaxID=8478 RepID=A0A8C3HG50_CHRPI